MKSEEKNEQETIPTIEGVEKIIYKFYYGQEELTKEEKETLLEANQQSIRNGKTYMLLIMAKEYIENGELAPERLKELLKKKRKEVELEGMKVEWKKDPTNQAPEKPSEQETER